MIRQDIQCLRAVAITSVIFFHVYPEYFPNGYLGVDIFFVISGYLMASVLSQNQLNFKTMSTFYYRRIKRIWPVYYLIILLILISKQYLQTDVWWRVNNVYAFFASLFFLNHKIIHDQADYFNSFKSDNKSANLFLHCWSISVEVQFYAIVPFIYYGIQLLHNQYQKIAALFILFSSSYSITFLSADPNFTFNFMPARIWQFVAGMLVFVLKTSKGSSKSEKEDDTERKFIFKQLELVGFSTIFFVFFPIVIRPDVIRPLITLITAFVIYNEFGKINMILSSKILSYIGDISYILYLVHWPIWVYFRYSYDRFAILYLILIVSIIIHHSFETLILRQNIYIVLSVTATLIILISIFQILFLYNPSFISRSFSLENKPLVRQNKKFQEMVWEWPKCKNGKNQRSELGHCKFENGNGTLKVLVTGNSYALNQADLIRRSFAGNYSTFEYLAIVSNFGIFGNHLQHLSESLERSKELVAEVKPDVLFIIARVSPEQKQPITPNDIAIQQYNENLKFYEGFSKKIYIMDAFPLFPLNYLNFFIENLQMEYGRMNIFRYSKEEVDKETKYAKERLKRINCKKCEVYDLGSVFLDDGYYYGYDKKTLLAYIDDGIHLTDHGLEAILPFYTNLTSNIDV